MNNLEVIYPLNDYLPQKSKCILRAVSRIFRELLVLKNYRHTFLKLDVSMLNIIKMYVDSAPDICRFYDLVDSLRLFRYCAKRYHHWNKIHWNYVYTFLIYRYLKYEHYLDTERPFMFYYTYFVVPELIVDIYTHFNENNLCDIKSIYRIVNIHNQQNTQDLIFI
jgi:hypothetical protein